MLDRETMQDRRTCWGLVRGSGAIGFLFASAMAFSFAKSKLHLDFSTLSFSELSHRHIAYLALTVLFALGGVLVGQTAGYLIPVRSDAVARNVDAFWHFTANTTIYWTPVAALVFSLAMGKPAARAFRISHTVPQMAWLAFGIPVLAACAVLVLSIFCFGILTRVASAPTVRLVVYVAPSLACFAFGGWEARSLGLNPAWGLVMAITPFIVIPASLAAMRKDSLRRGTM